MEIIWTLRAIQKINEITDWIAQDNLTAANEWVQEVFKKTDQLIEHPRSGRMVPEYNEPDLRELLFGQYRLIYRVSDNQSAVYIQTLHHMRQEMPGSSHELFR